MLDLTLKFLNIYMKEIYRNNIRGYEMLMTKSNVFATIFFFVIGFTLYNVQLITASRGDSSPIFRDCLLSCRNLWNCSVDPTAYAWKREKCFRFNF